MLSFCRNLVFLSLLSALVTCQSSTSASPGGKITSAPILTGSTAASSTPTPASGSSDSGSGSSSSTTTVGALSGPPDVLLNVPTLSVGRIELDVEQLSADINLNANVAGLVSINAGVAVSVQEVNITIANVDAQLELIVRLGHLVDIVNRVFSSLDLNPLLISTLNNVTSLVGEVVGAVDGLLGSITQGGTTLNFLIDNLGNIVQEVLGSDGSTVSSIVGSYLNNMTFTGATEALGNGLTQKTYSYSPLNALVNIIFNTLGQVVQATVVKQTGTGTGTASSSASSAAPTSSAASSAASSST